MASKVAEAYVEIRATQKRLRQDMAGVHRYVGGAMKKLSRAITLPFRMLRGPGGLLGAAAGGLGLFAIIREAGKFEQEMAQSMAIMTGAGQRMAELRKQARQLAVQWGVSAADIAKGYFYLASAGMNAEQSLANMPLMVEFARAGMFDLATATDLLTDSLSAMGLASKDPQKNLANMTMLADLLVGANKLANTSVQQVAEALTNRWGAAMKSANMDAREGIALLALFADQGRKGAVAGNEATIMLRDMQGAIRRNTKAFEKYNIEVYKGGKIRPMADILRDFERAFGDLSVEAKGAALSELGFTRASLAIMQMVIGTSGRLTELNKSMNKVGGSVKEVATKNMDTFFGSLKRMMAAVKDLAIAIGTPLMRALEQVVVPLKDVFLKGSETVNRFMKRNLPQFIAMRQSLSEIAHNLKLMWAAIGTGTGMVGQFVDRTISGLQEILDTISLITMEGKLASKTFQTHWEVALLKVTDFFHKWGHDVVGIFIGIDAALGKICDNMLKTTKQFFFESLKWLGQFGMPRGPTKYRPFEMPSVNIAKEVDAAFKGGFHWWEAKFKPDPAIKILQDDLVRLTEELKTQRDVRKAEILASKWGYMAGKTMAEWFNKTYGAIRGKVVGMMPGEPAPAAAAAAAAAEEAKPGKAQWVGLVEFAKQLQTAIMDAEQKRFERDNHKNHADIARTNKRIADGVEKLKVAPLVA